MAGTRHQHSTGSGLKAVGRTSLAVVPEASLTVVGPNTEWDCRRRMKVVEATYRLAPTEVAGTHRHCHRRNDTMPRCRTEPGTTVSEDNSRTQETDVVLQAET